MVNDGLVKEKISANNSGQFMFARLFAVGCTTLAHHCKKYVALYVGWLTTSGQRQTNVCSLVHLWNIPKAQRTL
jgi:hypothetical protein